MLYLIYWISTLETWQCLLPGELEPQLSPQALDSIHSALLTQVFTTSLYLLVYIQVLPMDTFLLKSLFLLGLSFKTFVGLFWNILLSVTNEILNPMIIPYNGHEMGEWFLNYQLIIICIYLALCIGNILGNWSPIEKSRCHMVAFVPDKSHTWMPRFHDNHLNQSGMKYRLTKSCIYSSALKENAKFVKCSTCH